MNVESVLPRDAIPSIDDPAFGVEYRGDPGDEVIVVDADPPRAYPIRILSYHEIVNDVLVEDGSANRSTGADGAGDVLNGRAIAVTWCPICWSGVVYDRTVDGRRLTFGVSGMLADDALVMYDRETGSSWKQTTGVAIDGELSGTCLPVLPSPMVSWERFTLDHPDGVVLQPVRGRASGTDGAALSSYDMEPYERYVEREAFGRYGMRGDGEPRRWEHDDLDAKTPVLGIEHGGDAVAYPVPVVEAAGGAIHDTVGGREIVVIATTDGIHAFENPGFVFERSDDQVIADGTAWDGVTGESHDGRRLERVPGRRLFAFAWNDAHGHEAFFTY